MKLIHYTKFKLGLNVILDKMRIRFNPLALTNDPYEYKKNTPNVGADKELSDENLEIFFKAENNIINQGIKVGCFVSESNNNWKDGAGIRKPRMWAQYGENHSGLAFVLDKNKFINECKKHKKTKWGMASQKVKYIFPKTLNNTSINPSTFHLENGKNINLEEIEKKLFQNAKSYWFNKHKDWKAENEFRIMVYSKSQDSLNVDISSSLEGIILGDKVGKSLKPMLKYYYRSKGFDIFHLKYSSSLKDYELL